MTTDAVIEAVRGELWAYQPEFACPVCGRVSVDGKAHLACLAFARRAVQETETVKGMARLLGVTGHE